MLSCSDNLPYEKVGNNEPICIAEEVPFDIPDSWEWIRLGNIGITQTGNTPSKAHLEYFNGKTPFISPADILNFNINYNNQSLSDIGKKYGRICSKGSILQVCIGGSIGKLAITNMEIAFNQQINSITPLYCSELYLFYVMDTQYFYQLLKEKSGGTATPIINRGVWDTLLIPLPPIEEQQRIVDKLKELEPYIQEYDIAYEKIEKLNNNFPEQLKKSILQDAVQGKLVPQNPNDEPASVLIERIREEKQKLIQEKKIKKDKNESYIFRRDNSHYEKIGKEERCIDDEIPFDIPDSWEWTRLGTITEILRGKGPKYADNTDFRILNQKCVRWGNIDTSFCKTVDKQWFESISKECLTTQKDILINSTGEGTIGRSSAVTSDAINMPYDSHVLLIRPYKCLNKYIEIFINGIEGQAQINRSKGAKTTKQTELGVDKTKNLLIPLPPLNEQQRIVDKVNQLLPQISKL